MTHSRSNKVLYKDILFDSLLEAQWASFFDTISVRYQYRPARFNLSPGLSPGLDQWYEPQFLLVDDRKWFEAFPRLGRADLWRISWALVFGRHIHSCTPLWPSSPDCYVLAFGPVGADSDKDPQSGIFSVADIGLDEPEAIICGGGATLTWAQCGSCGNISLYNDEEGLLSWPDEIVSGCCGVEQTGHSAQRDSPELLRAYRVAHSLTISDGAELALT
jgi:hypothetical protein